jgi:hypothetical protein
MYAAGETSTTLTAIAAAGYAWQSDAPGGGVLFAVVMVWMLLATIATAVVPRGDYAWARRALQGG